MLPEVPNCSSSLHLLPSSFIFVWVWDAIFQVSVCLWACDVCERQIIWMCACFYVYVGVSSAVNVSVCVCNVCSLSQVLHWCFHMHDSHLSSFGKTGPSSILMQPTCTHVAQTHTHTHTHTHCDLSRHPVILWQEWLQWILITQEKHWNYIYTMKPKLPSYALAILPAFLYTYCQKLLLRNCVSNVFTKKA